MASDIKAFGKTIIAMKKRFLLLTVLITLFSLSSFAQGDDKEIPIDTLLDIDAAKNLDVAWQYFKLRKAYKAVLMRTDETLAAHPTYSKIDEVFYLHGMSSYYLANGKGKQKIVLKDLTKDEQERYSKEKLNEDALLYLQMLVGEHPESKYIKKAKKVLDKIKPKKE